MSINFNRLYPLLFLIPLGVILWISYKGYLSQHYKGSVIFRFMVLTLLILSMCGIHLVRTAEDVTTIFLVDRSHSTEDSFKDMTDFISQAIEHKGDHDLIGVIAFGQDAKIEQMPDKNPLFSEFQTNPNGEFTNIQTGMIAANALIPSDTKRRIVLMTDGYENMGDGLRQVAGIYSSGTGVDMVDYAKRNFPEVQFDDLTVPEKVEKNQTIQVESRIMSNMETTGTLYVFSNNEVKFEKPVTLKEGENQFVFTDTISDSGLVTYSAQIIPEEDTYVENNYRSTFTFVNDLPHILVIQGEDQQALNLMGMLEYSAVLDVMKPNEVPTTMEEVIKYDGFIMSNVSLNDLDRNFLVSLEEAVRMQGKGLLVTGGETSYGPGGYYQTLLEDMLPLKMDAKPKEEKPNLGLILVIDKSGSMSSGEYGVSKMEMAKEAAIRSLDVLEDKDYIGVLGFDSQPKWVVEPVLAVDKTHIEKQISSMGPGGGTTIQPSLKQALSSLIDLDVGLKHIILLTDGQAETDGYLPLLEKMEEEDITLSTVAVGTGADKNLLSLLAEYGNGRFYVTDVFTDIPSIFTKEAFMAGKKYLNNVTFYPRLEADSPILSGISAIPQLDGYVATEAKDKAKIILTGPDHDPILASWQYGLGRTVAFTSDLKGLWSSRWLAWEENQTLWINTVSWMVQQDLNKDYTIDGYYEDGNGYIEVSSLIKGKNYPSLKGIIAGPDGETHEIELPAKAPGKYLGMFEPAGQGVYLISLQLGQGEDKEQVITALNIAYSDEYDFFSSDRMTPSELVAISKGRILKSPLEVFDGDLPPVSASRDISPWLLLAALILFMMEIVWRKYKPHLDPVKHSFELVAARVSNRRIDKKKPKENKASDHVNRLLDGKKKR